MENEIKTCSFIGHRTVSKPELVKEKVLETVENLIVERGVTKFLFGSKSQFDDLSLSAVTLLKEKYPYIKRVYVRSNFAEISDKYEEYLLELYDETYIPERVINAKRKAYVVRNYEMIDKSNVCVMYYSESYSPPAKKRKSVFLIENTPRSGTRIAYEYAVSKNREIINILDMLI